MSPSFQRTLTTLDALIAKHGASNPELKQQLEEFRSQLIEAQQRKNAADVAKIAFQLASWARWVVDLFT